MKQNNNTSTNIEMSNAPPLDDPLHEIGGYKVCTNGLAAYRDYHGVRRRERVSEEQVEIAKEFLKLCRPMKSVQPNTCPINGTLKHDIERWARTYVGRGAVIVAALELGITIKPYYGIDPDDDFEPVCAIIGINIRDVERMMKWVRQ
jgi:hypothetical protein